MEKIKSASVVGLGKLGASMAACFAKSGIKTVGVDINLRSVEAINSGLSPVSETDLALYISKYTNNLTATVDYEDAILQTDATFVIVPTPSEDHGGFSLKYAKEAFKRIGKALRKKNCFHLIVMTSTVLPGGTELSLLPILEKASGKECGRHFGLCYSPEFIALGSVIRDFLAPDFVLIGEHDNRSGQMLEEFYLNVCENNPPFARMNIANAELTKMSINSFMTMKISFANMISGICENIPNGDVDKVTKAIGMFGGAGKSMTGGLGYGGPCLPRDNLALSFLAAKVGMETVLPTEIDKFNRSIPDRLADKVCEYVAPNETVCILGLSYKTGTWVTEESQGISLASILIQRKRLVKAFDPLSKDSIISKLKDSVNYPIDISEAISNVRMIIVTNPDPFFLNLHEYHEHISENTLVLDVWRYLPKTELIKRGFNYLSMGQSKDNKKASKILKAINQ